MYGFAGIPGFFKKVLVYPGHCPLKVHASCSHDLSYIKQEHTHSPASLHERRKGTTNPPTQTWPLGLSGSASVWFDVIWAAITYPACALGLFPGRIPWLPRWSKCEDFLLLSKASGHRPPDQGLESNSQTLPDCEMPNYWGTIFLGTIFPSQLPIFS